MTLLLTSLTLSLTALLVSHWMGRSNPGRSSTLTAGMMLLLLFLPLTQFSPKLQVSIDWLYAGTPQLSDTNAPLSQAGLSIAGIILGVWLVGFLILTARLLKHYLAVRKWRRTSERCSSPRWTHRLHESCALLDIDSIPSLGICDHIASPVVTGVVYPQILLPRHCEQWSEETLDHVLLHELGHVKRRDLWVSIASHLTCAIHWFNPFVWKLKKRQASQCEFACDAYVLASGANAKNYIHALCDVAESATDSAPVALALAMANKASLRQRVEILLHDKKSSSRLMTCAVLILSAGSACALNLIQPVPRVKVEADKPAEQHINYPPEEIKKRLEADPFPG